MPEEDAPVRRRAAVVSQKTTHIDATTSPHRSTPTNRLPEFPVLPPEDAPVRLVREPTELLDAPTSVLPSAPVSMSAVFESVEPFDRLARAAEQLRSASENLDVDRRSHTAQLFIGAAAALTHAPTHGPIEHVGARLAQRLLLVDAGVGGRFTEDQLGQALITIATEVIAGVDPHRRAARALATDCEAKAMQYRALARAALAKDPPEHLRAAQWEERADERESIARELRKESR